MCVRIVRCVVVITQVTAVRIAGFQFTTDCHNCAYIAAGVSLRTRGEVMGLLHLPILNSLRTIGGALLAHRNEPQPIAQVA